MPPEPAPVFLVGEDVAHEALAVQLFDGRLMQRVQWLDAPEHVREWKRPSWAPTAQNDRPRVDAKSDPPRRIHGRLQGQPYKEGARKLRQWVVSFAQETDEPSILIVMTDTDGKDRRAGIDQIKSWLTDQNDLPHLVVGCAHRDAEAWFMPLARLESGHADRLALAKQALSFDPASQPERLSTGKSDPKRVVRFVLMEEGESLPENEPGCATPPAHAARNFAERLRTHLDNLGDYQACGLTPFLHDIDDALIAVGLVHP